MGLPLTGRGCSSPGRRGEVDQMAFTQTPLSRASPNTLNLYRRGTEDNYPPYKRVFHFTRHFATGFLGGVLLRCIQSSTPFTTA